MEIEFKESYDDIATEAGFTLIPDVDDEMYLFRRDHEGFSVAVELPMYSGSRQGASVTLMLDLGLDDGLYASIDEVVTDSVGDALRSVLPLIDRQLNGKTHTTDEGMDLSYEIPIRSVDDVVSLFEDLAA